MGDDGVLVHLTEREVLIELWIHARAGMVSMQDGLDEMADIHRERHNAYIEAYEDSLADDEEVDGDA